MSEARPTLYERIGGAEVVDNLVGEFYRRVLADPKLAPFFERSSMDKLRLMQHEFFSAALGGPVQYTGMPLSEAHFGRGIRRRHFQRFVEILFETLESYDLDRDDVDSIIERVNTYVDDVVGGIGEAG